MSGIVEQSYSGGKAIELGKLIRPITERNKISLELPVLSVSNSKGFVSQSEQFEDRIIASEDKSGYKIVRKDDFAFNPARINIGSIARLKHLDEGIVSPMYVCFRANEALVPEYLEYFFKTRCFANEVSKRLEGSVRLCLTIEGLKQICISLPSKETQNRISQRLNSLQTRANIEKRILALYRQQKDWFLSNLFI